MHPTPEGPANDQRNARARSVAELGHHVDDLVECAGNEVCELHLDDRPPPHQCGAGGGSHDGGFRDGGVDHAKLAELLQETLRDLEGAAVLGDVFPDEKDSLIPLHLFPQRLPNRLDVGDL